jgi:hypothetical protein
MGDNGLWIGVVALCCLTPLILVVGIGGWALLSGGRWLEQLLHTDGDQLHTRYLALKAAQPDAPHVKLARKVIHEQAMRCGWIGALTSVGGIFTLPLALPLDLITSLQAQAAMVDLIAQIFGVQQRKHEREMRGWLIVTGGEQLVGMSFDLFFRLATRLLPKFAAKLIPFAGALIGFGVNYAIARASGEAALLWYQGRGQGQGK